MPIISVSYKKQTIIKDTVCRLQRELHLTKRQMHQKFPDLLRALREEEIQNMLADVRRVEAELIYSPF